MQFKTHEEAISYAKHHPGVIITRASAQNEFIINNSDDERQSLKNIDLIKDARQLLLDTQKELRYICSCILQTDAKTTYSITQKAGEIIVSKLGGIGASGSVLGLISTFGTVGTGTAISSLSGAAATNATLAVLGSVVGGGMFAGGALVVGITAGTGIFLYRFIRSKPREYDTLPLKDREIVDRCFILIKAIEEETAGIIIPSNEKVREFGKNDIVPLYKLLKEHKDDIKSNLDMRNSTALTMRVLPNFDKLIVRYSTI